MMRRVAALAMACALAVVPAHTYVLNTTIASNGGCPQLDRFDTQTAGKLISRRWSASANSAIRTSSGAWTGDAQQTTEIGQVIADSFAFWSGVAGTTLTSSKLAALQTTPTQSACLVNDGQNTICFNQSTNFDAGVLAFTRNLTAEATGGSVAFVGEIIDSDIVFRPSDSSGFTFATPAALAGNASSFDLESVLAHELGHTFGLSHSSVWRALMWPFAPTRGTFVGQVAGSTTRELLSDDDRVGLRVLYPSATDTVNIGSISGRVLLVNPISLAGLPAPSPGRSVAGIFGAHVVAVDAGTGAVVAGVFAGWACDPGNLPTRFDGTYVFERLPVGRNYLLFAEPLDGPTASSNISVSLNSLCRSGTNNSCTVPGVNTNFNTRVKPAP